MNKYILIIGFLLIVSFYFSINDKLCGDEGLYSIAIKDNIELGLQSTATYYGESMYWKPSLMFNIYGILASPFYNIISEEILFRTISFLFVILSLFILFKFFEKEFKSDEKAYLGIILLLITPAFFGFSIRVLTDTLVFLFFALTLYCSQRFQGIYKILFVISIIGIGLTKSIVLSLFGIIISIVYYLHKNNKINYEMLLYGFVSLLLIFTYSNLLQIEKLNEGDLQRTYFFNLEPIVIFANIFNLLRFFGIIIIPIFFFRKNIIYLFTLLFMFYLLFNNATSLPWYIFPILPFFCILFLNLDIEKMKEILVIVLIWNVVIMLISLGLLNHGNNNMNIVSELDLNETIYIGRLGEVVANKMYDSNGVMVTPQNSFRVSKYSWGGSPEKMTKENLLGLIYDYENPELWPVYVEELSVEEKYIPPIARTHKKFDGSFKQIIIEEKYFLKIEEEILEDYEIVRIIDEEKSEFKVEEKIYVLSIKEEFK